MTTKPAKNASVEPEAVAIADIVPGGATGALTPNEDVAAVYADIDTLVEWAKNPRNNQKAILKVAKSIRRVRLRRAHLGPRRKPRDHCRSHSLSSGQGTWTQARAGAIHAAR